MGGMALGEGGNLGFGETAQSALEVSWWIVGGTTIWSGLSYLSGRKGVRILGKKG